MEGLFRLLHLVVPVTALLLKATMAATSALGSPAEPTLASLPRELLAMVVGKLDPIDAVRLAELTCKQLRAEIDLSALWLRLSLEAGLQAVDGASLSALRRAYSRHEFHQRGVCAKCGSRVRGRTRSVVDSAPLEGSHMHLCAWLVQQS